MTEQPPTLLYYREPVQDELGDGLRILTSHDDVYEARAAEDIETRIYSDGEQWQAKVQNPVTDMEEAYDRVVASVNSINDLGDAGLAVDPEVFLEGVDRYDTFGLEGNGFTVKYRETGEGLEATGLSDGAQIAYFLGGWGSYAGAGATGGFAVGGPPGALVGGLGGAAAYYLEALFNADAGDLDLEKVAENKSRSPMMLPYRGIRSAKNRVRNWRHRRSQRKAQEQYQQPELLNDVNELHCILSRMQQNNTIQGHEQRDRLKDKDPDETLEAALNIAFHRFEEQPGVTATGTFELYDDAAAFMATLTDTDTPTTRPSIYTRPDAFKTIFERCVEYDLTDDQQILTQNAHKNGSANVLSYLEDEHPDLFHNGGIDFAAGGGEA